jgi:chlorobactene glucosyltransferase
MSMPDALVIFPVLAVLSLAGSLGIFIYLLITERDAPKFSFSFESVLTSQGKPKVSIVVTAKNEEQMIGKCLESLLTQTYDHPEIIVVDDSSTDHTADKVAKLAAQYSNLRLVFAGPKPTSWVGKSWPCWRGFQEAKGEYLLFVDADSIFESRIVERSVIYAEQNSIDVFSLAPRVEVRGWMAKAVLPLITGAINLLYPMKKVNDRKSKRAYVFGTYILVRKEVYEKTGGHSKVRDQLVEDAAIAQLAKSAGYNLRVEGGGDLITTEWESDPKAIFHGLERVTSTSIKTYGIVSVLNAILLFFLIIYPVLFILSSLLLRAFSEIFLLGLVASILNVILFLSLTAREMHAVSGRAGPEIFLYFVGGLIFIAAIVTTSIKVTRGKDLYWKGQGYKQVLEKNVDTLE